MNASAHPRSIAPDKGSLRDEVLVRHILHGEHELFALLMQRYDRRLFRLVRSVVRDDDSAEDVVQQAYLAAYRSLARFRGNASFATWLSRIALNEAYRRQRAEARHPHVALISDDGPMAESAGPDEDTYRHEMARVLEHQIDQLPARLRAVFVLRDVEELDTAQTAACLDLSPAAVRVRLHRARHLLQGSLARVLRV